MPRKKAGQALSFAAIADQRNAADYRTERSKTFGRGTVLHRLVNGEPAKIARNS